MTRDPYATRTFSTGLAPITHPRDVERNPHGAEMWERYGDRITVHVDDLQQLYVANPTGSIMLFDLPPEHTTERALLDAKIARGELAIVPDEHVDVVTVDEPTGRNHPPFTTPATHYRLRDGAPAPTFPQAPRSMKGI